MKLLRLVTGCLCILVVASFFARAASYAVPGESLTVCSHQLAEARDWESDDGEDESEYC